MAEVSDALGSVVQIEAPADLRLRDVAALNAQITAEVGNGATLIQLVGASTMTGGSRLVLQGLSERLAAQGVQLQLCPE